MFIKSIKAKNFKCFADNELELCIPDGNKPGSGLNIFVGENNSGKSSLMEAVDFLRNKSKKDVKRIDSNEEENFVELTFVGDKLGSVIENFVQENKQDPFKKCIYTKHGDKLLTVRRKFGNDEEAKKILFYEDSESKFKNPAGIDGPFQKFLQISNVWADTNPESESRYGSSTVCGNLLSDISEKFKIDHKDQWNNFIKMFNETFNDDTGGLQKDLNIVANETEEILNEQFGQAKLRFKFDNPEPDLQFKNIKILVHDGEETEISEKGHGMQRAVILSLLQVYAKRITKLKKDDGSIVFKPHFLFIDEPEMGLHPQAQRKLFDALKVIAQDHQVFISTHSENFISVDLIENVYRFQKSERGISITAGKNLDIDLGANRKFFLHHHKLFFSKKAIFVEGADDYERYPLYLKKLGKSEMIRDISMLGGCEKAGLFKSFCDHFGIESSFILDLDVIAKNNSTAKSCFIKEIANKITTLNIESSSKDPSNLLDKNLDSTSIKLKNSIIEDLLGHNIYVLKNGSVEQYLDDGGNPKDNNGAELSEIFTKIESTIPQ